MHKRPLNLLSLAGLLTIVAVLLHVGCIFFDASWYRFMGAGEQMAQIVERGETYPTIVTSVVTLVLLVWAAYAFSGAGKILQLPLLRTGLVVIATILLARGLGFYFIMAAFPGNSLTFWIVSSSICVVLGLLYALGTKQSWQSMSGPTQ
ncbi:MAG: hypothetical protein AAAFM81_10450 [Pseudomonadota bacterium]